MKSKILLTLSGISPYITELTRKISVKPTALSKIMDTANGGTGLHGGLHRVAGGHSIADMPQWLEHGSDYAYELSKDIITPYGLPLPGVETLVNNGYISKYSATKYLSLNIGEALGVGFAMVDTYRTRRGIAKGRIDPQSNKIIIKGCIKIGIAVATENPLVGVSGAIDICLNINDRRKMSNTENESNPWGDFSFYPAFI